MKKELRRKIVTLAVLAAVLLVAASGCSLFRKIDIIGTWHDVYGGKRVVTESTISVYWLTTDTEPAWIYEIVDFDNEAWNGGDTGEGEAGYAVVMFSTAPADNPEFEGTYTVFRWQNLQNTDGVLTMEYSEGSPPTWPVGYEDSATDAAANATESNGWFAWGYTSATLQ